MKTNRTALFIDGPNLYACSKALKIELDFKTLLKYYGSDLVRAYYYTAIVEEGEEYSSIRPLIDWLSYNGYSIVSKPAKQFLMPDGRTKTKGNMDCEMTVDALMLSVNRAIDHAVFFTGDGDFKPLLLAMQPFGVRCTVISSIQTKPAMCADELRRICDNFIDLAEFGQMLQRDEEPFIKPRSKYATSPGR